MNEAPKSNWTKPLTGKRKWLAWVALLGVGTLIITAIGLALGNHGPVGELVLASFLIALVMAVLGWLLVWFIRWLCCWRNFRRFAFGVACFITLILLGYAVENWRGKRAWESHKREWIAKGEKFTIAELAPAPAPDEQNFALTPLLKPSMDFTYQNSPGSSVVWRDTNGLARLQNVRADLRDDGTDQDKLTLGSPEKGTFADLAVCREFYRGNTNYPQPAVAGTAAEDILVALGKFDEELKELHEAAAARPRTRFPIEYESQPAWGILLPHLSHIKGLTILTHVRAVAELEARRPADAFADLKLGFRFSDNLREEPLLINHLVRIASLAINLQTVREGLVRHAWTDAQLAELEKYLGSLNLLAEYKLAQRGERALTTSGLDWLSRQGIGANAFNYLSSDEGGGGFAPISWAFPSGWLRQNMLTISRMHQDFTLAAADEHARRVFPEVCDRLDSNVEKMRYRPYTTFAKLLMPALSKAIRRSARMQTTVDAARVALALERYRIANDALPDTLEALVPHFLRAIPNDLLDGKPLRYRRNPDGGYLLYSVGWNQTDDNGEIAWSKGKDPSVDISKGDWVWQMPAR